MSSAGKTFATLAIVFLAGIGLDRWVFHDQDLKAEYATADALHSGQSHPLSEPGQHPGRVGSTVQNEPLALASAGSSSPSPVLVLAPEAEDALTRLIENPFPELGSQISNPQSDGSIVSQETAPDGEVIYRHYNSRGTLTSENWTKPSGEEVARTFYGTGGMKAFLRKGPDGSMTTVSYGDDGNREGRVDTTPDHTTFATSFDEHGAVTGVWKTGPDSKTTKVQ